MIEAILVDDEANAVENLSLMLKEHCPDIVITGTASNALQAVKVITDKKPQVVFLDVQMPGYNGFEVLENLGRSETLVVFTTAHKDYAIEALREGAMDYLLKPIDAQELTSCVDRVRQKIQNKDQGKKRQGLIELAVRGSFIYVHPESIIRLEASGSYTHFYLEGKVNHLVSKSIKEYEIQLDPLVYYRCHNSHLVNLRKVVKFNISDYSVELTDGSLIEIARKNKEEFMSRLRGLEL